MVARLSGLTKIMKTPRVCAAVRKGSLRVAVRPFPQPTLAISYDRVIRCAGGLANIDWRYRGDYVRTRSTRRARETDIEPDWASEAAADPLAQIIGYSPSADLVITVIVDDNEATTYGVNAWRANRTDEREYWENA